MLCPSTTYFYDPGREHFVRDRAFVWCHDLDGASLQKSSTSQFCQMVSALLCSRDFGGTMWIILYANVVA